MEADWADDIAVTLFDEFMGSDVIVEPTAKALRKVRAEAEIVGLKRAIELVLEVGTGHADRTKNITDYIESHIRVLERGASEG